jgi:hypothetical protein
LVRERAVLSARLDDIETSNKLRADRVLILALAGWLFALGIGIYVKMIV